MGLLEDAAASDRRATGDTDQPPRQGATTAQATDTRTVTIPVNGEQTGVDIRVNTNKLDSMIAESLNK